MCIPSMRIYSFFILIIVMVRYSVILPTYNERENLPLIVYLIFDMAEQK